MDVRMPLCRQNFSFRIKYIIHVCSLRMICKFYVSDFVVSVSNCFIVICYILVNRFLWHLSRFTAPILPQIIPFLGKNKDNLQALEGKFKSLAASCS